MKKSGLVALVIVLAIVAVLGIGFVSVSNSIIRSEEEAVSYTHLDVYKRQLLCLPLACSE